MVNWLNLPLQTYDLRTVDGRDGLRVAVNTIGVAKKAIVETLLREKTSIYVSYTFGFVPPGKSSDGQDGLEAVLLILSAQEDPRMASSSGGVVRDLINKAAVFVDIAEQMYGRDVIDTSHNKADYPAYVDILKNSPHIGVMAKFSSEPIPLDIK